MDNIKRAKEEMIIRFVEEYVRNQKSIAERRNRGVSSGRRRHKEVKPFTVYQGDVEPQLMEQIKTMPYVKVEERWSEACRYASKSVKLIEKSWKLIRKQDAKGHRVVKLKGLNSFDYHLFWMFQDFGFDVIRRTKRRREYWEYDEEDDTEELVPSILLDKEVRIEWPRMDLSDPEVFQKAPLGRFFDR